MQASIVLGNLKNPEDVKRLQQNLEELYDLFDPIYTETAPNGNISAQRGKFALYLNGANYEKWQNIDGGTTWSRIDGAITQYGARAFLSSNQLNLTNATPTKVLLNSETFDIQGNFASNRFTSTVASYYAVASQVTYTEIVADKLYECIVQKNGGTGLNYYTQSSLVQSLTAGGADIVYLDVDDYLELWAAQHSGVNTVDIVGGTGVTFMAVMRIPILD